jgi:hypothetical protein
MLLTKTANLATVFGARVASTFDCTSFGAELGGPFFFAFVIFMLLGNHKESTHEDEGSRS